MIIPLSGGDCNGGVLDTGHISVLTGHGIVLGAEQYKMYPNGVARLVEPPYVTPPTGHIWQFSIRRVGNR